MKKVIVLLIVICFAVCLTGCAELISEEYKNVEVKIVDTDHRGTYVTHMRVGKVITTQVHPATFRTTVEYDGVEYGISGSEAYNKYKSKIGETAEAVLRICKYDDGSEEYDITELK